MTRGGDGRGMYSNAALARFDHAGATVGVAWDAAAGALLVAVDGAAFAPAFSAGIAPGAIVGSGLFPVLSGKGGCRVRLNLGQRPFCHSPPSAFVSFAPEQVLWQRWREFGRARCFTRSLKRHCAEGSALRHAELARRPLLVSAHCAGSTSECAAADGCPQPVADLFARVRAGLDVCGGAGGRAGCQRSSFRGRCAGGRRRLPGATSLWPIFARDPGRYPLGLRYGSVSTPCPRVRAVQGVLYSATVGIGGRRARAGRRSGGAVEGVRRPARGA